MHTLAFHIYLHTFITKYTLGRVSSGFQLAHVEELSSIDLASCAINVVKGFVKLRGENSDLFICADHLLQKI